MSHSLQASPPTADPKSLSSETTPLLLASSDNNTPPKLASRFALRRARFSDLAPAARTCSLAFWDDVLFGRLIHPYRATYPADVDKYWYRRFVVDWWDWSHVFLVTTERVPASEAQGVSGDVTGEARRCHGGSSHHESGPQPTIEEEQNEVEIVTGFAHWSRIAPDSRANYQAGWGLACWDPSKSFPVLVHFLLARSGSAFLLVVSASISISLASCSSFRLRFDHLHHAVRWTLGAGISSGIRFSAHGITWRSIGTLQVDATR